MGQLFPRSNLNGVLLATDDVVVAMALRRAMRASCPTHQLWVVESGNDALDLLHRAELGRLRWAVVTEILLPRMNGIELASAIRADQTLRKLTVLALVSSFEESKYLRMLRLPMSGYLWSLDFSPLLSILCGGHSSPSFDACS